MMNLNLWKTNQSLTYFPFVKHHQTVEISSCGDVTVKPHKLTDVIQHTMLKSVVYSVEDELAQNINICKQKRHPD